MHRHLDLFRPYTQGSLPQPLAAGRRALAALLLLIVTSCGQSITGLETRSPADVRFLHVAKGTPPLSANQIRFWAVKGRATTAALSFKPLSAGADSLGFFQFSLGANSLDRRPDGTAFAAGDSVLITMTVTDQYHLVLDNQPQGLKFSDADRPTLTISWASCGDDLNYDGVVDAADAQIVQQLGVWRQELPGQDWVRQASTISATARTVVSQLPGFSGYALMY